MTSDAQFRLAPGVDVVPLEGGEILFRSDTVLLRLEGESTHLLRDSMLPLLNSPRSLDEIAASVPGVSIQSVQKHLDELVRAGVLVRHLTDRDDVREEGVDAPFLAMVEALGLPPADVSTRLRDLHVSVFGLEAHGAWIADLLTRAGVGVLTLVDPYPCHRRDLSLLPPLGRDTSGVSRQDLVASLVAVHGASTQVRLWEGSTVEMEPVRSLAADCDFMVVTFDRGFSACRQWINRAALEHRVPAIFGELRGHRVLVGPIVLPLESACYLCWRMRSLACEDDFRDGMSYEEFLDSQRAPTLHERPSFPSSAPLVASLMTTEILKTVLAIGTPTLVGQVMQFDLMTFESSLHPVLQRPDCPACQKKKARSHRHPPLAELADSSERPGDILEAAGQLVSPLNGIIRSLSHVAKDPSEPEVPFIARAELANHRFLHASGDEFVICSGKGRTRAEARVTALGEAVERYSSALWSTEGITYGKRDQLTAAALDPARLVLYPAEMYETLDYHPYSEDTELGWVSARSLVTGELVLVPAIAVYMSYEVRSPEEYIFPVTSNGLAAGPALIDTVLSATLEVIERDAFINMWLLRLTCERVDPLSIPDPDLVAIARSYLRRGVVIELFRLPTDQPVHVFMGLAVQVDQADGPAAVVGLGADLDPVASARKAVLEVAQVRPALRIRMREPETRERIQLLVEDPQRVTSLEDHDLLYTSRSTLGSFDFLRQTPVSEVDWGVEVGRTTVDRLAALVDYLGENESDVLYCDLTSPDMAALGLHTARAIIPDYQPIYFGVRERRIGGTRLFKYRALVGQGPTLATIADLNPDPHPLA